MKSSVLTNQKAICGGRQPITSESNGTEDESVRNTYSDAASIKETIRETLNKQSDKMNTSESEVQQLAIKPPVKRQFTLALIDKDTNMPLKIQHPKDRRKHFGSNS